MIGLRPFEVALIAAIILAVLELATGTFILLGFSLGCLAVAAAEFFTAGFNLYRDALLSAATAFLAILALRLAFARPGDTKPVKGDVNDY